MLIGQLRLTSREAYVSGFQKDDDAILHFLGQDFVESGELGTMVFLLLEIKAELESITNLVPKGGSDGSEYTFFFKVVRLLLFV